MSLACTKELWRLPQGSWHLARMTPLWSGTRFPVLLQERGTDKIGGEGNMFLYPNIDALLGALLQGCCHVQSLVASEKNSKVS